MNSLWLFTWWFIVLSTPTVDCLLDVLRELVFPKHPIITKIRNPSEARAQDAFTILHFIALVEQHGYPAEEHNITTEDGYHIALHRISGSPLSQSSSNDKPVVFLQHGLLASSDIWVLMGPGRDLAFLLADAGYDVWLGNVRGNSYCRSHVSLNTADAEFWKFSYTEMALGDVRSAIDYILNLTGKNTILYIGHSMGTTIIYTLLSTMPEYNEKVSLVVSFSPVAYQRHSIRSTIDRVIRNTPEVKEILDSNEVYDILPQTIINALMASKFCSDFSPTQPICIWFYFEISGVDREQLNTTLLPYYLKYLPAGVSTQTLYHYYQNVITRTFNMYDYGSAEKNLKQYNQIKPPAFEVDKITAPVVLFYGAGDILVKREDALPLYRKLKNVVLFEEVPYKKFSHLDFLWAIEAKEILYDRVIALINKFRT